MSWSVPPYVRTLIVCGVIAGIAIGLNTSIVTVAEQQRSALVREAQRLDDLSDQAHAVVRAVASQALALDDYLLTGAPTDMQRFYDATTAEHRISFAMRGASRDLPGVIAALDALAGATSAWRATIAEPALRTQPGTVGVSAGGAGTASLVRAPIDRAATSLVDQIGVARGDVRQRDAQLTATQGSAKVVEVAAGVIATVVALLLIWRAGRALERDARHSAVINRFTESTAFASDDRVVASSNLEALALLVGPDAGVVHILNRSKDRAIPEASVGDAIAEVLPLKTLADCPGMFRGSTHVIGDASMALSARCPVYPASAGTVACVPLISGESVGAVHLHWARPNSLPLTTLPDVNRLAQHAALAIANRRLLAALQGQASTDARTGLPNSRAFDVALEAALADLTHGSSISVLMLDLDHFKDFNDRHGHPAGDEALRVFAGVLAASVRDNDLAARYGGEEFTVLLPGLALSEALVVAERIRQRSESTLISLAPGITDRITVSVGVASAPDQGTDRVSLLRAADEALYRAKDAGRNRVAHLHDATPLPALPAAVA